MKEEAKRLLFQFGIKPDPLKDQFFLIDKNVLTKIVQVAKIKPDERIVEIGPGLGFITQELAKYSNNILAIEIDKRFKPILDKLHPNVRVIYGDAWKVLISQKISFDKLISNLPYSLCEPMMHKFTHGKFKIILFIIPQKFLYKILNHHIFSAYYQIDKLLDISRDAFYPVPKSNAVLVKISRLPNPLKTENISCFIRRFLYEHKQALVKNTLTEAMIKIYDNFYKQKLTKNEARKIVRAAGITPNFLEEKPVNPEIYFEAGEKLEKKIKESFN